MSLSTTLLQVKALWWNSVNVYVRCPLCQEIHRHGRGVTVPNDYATVQSRSSQCAQENHCRYEIRFPFDNVPGEVGYDIDKQRGLFVTGGADPAAYCARWEGYSFSMDLSSRPRWSKATETIAIPGDDTFSRLELAVSDVCCGHIEAVRRYLDDSKEADILIHGVEDDSDDDGNISGKTALHLAACEASPDMVRLLLERGADPNSQDSEGRTPLIQAALWGRLQSVEALLHHGADKEKLCLRRGEWLRAVDFARPGRENKMERRMHRDDIYERDRDREAIV